MEKHVIPPVGIYGEATINLTEINYESLMIELVELKYPQAAQCVYMTLSNPFTLCSWVLEVSLFHTSL